MTREERESQWCREALRRHWELRAQQEREAVIEARLLALEWKMGQGASLGQVVRMGNNKQGVA